MWFAIIVAGGRRSGGGCSASRAATPISTESAQSRPGQLGVAGDLDPALEHGLVVARVPREVG